MAGPFKMKGSSFYGKGNQSPVRHLVGKSAHDDAHDPNKAGDANKFIDNDHNTATTIKNKAIHEKKLAKTELLKKKGKGKELKKSSPATHTVTVGEKKGAQASTRKGANTHNSAHTSGHFVNNKHDTKSSLANRKIHDKKLLAKKKAKSSPATHTTNRLGHEKNYGKGHENSAHPKYWKKKKDKDTGKEGKTPKKIEIEKSDYMKRAFPHMSPRT